MMDIEKLRQLLDSVQHGQATVDEALERMRLLPYEDLGYAQLDLHRALRNGIPEVVFCQGKTVEQAAAILKRLWEHHARVMGTRASPEENHPRGALRPGFPPDNLGSWESSYPTNRCPLCFDRHRRDCGPSRG